MFENVGKLINNSKIVENIRKSVKESSVEFHNRTYSDNSSETIDFDSFLGDANSNNYSDLDYLCASRDTQEATLTAIDEASRTIVEVIENKRQETVSQSINDYQSEYQNEVVSIENDAKRYYQDIIVRRDASSEVEQKIMDTISVDDLETMSREDFLSIIYSVDSSAKEKRDEAERDVNKKYQPIIDELNEMNGENHYQTFGDVIQFLNYLNSTKAQTEFSLREINHMIDMLPYQNMLEDENYQSFNYEWQFDDSQLYLLVDDGFISYQDYVEKVGNISPAVFFKTIIERSSQLTSYSNLVVTDLDTEKFDALLLASDIKPDFLKMYNYIYATQGLDAANQYLNVMMDEINKTIAIQEIIAFQKTISEGGSITDALERTSVISFKGLIDGVRGWREGLTAFNNNQRYRSVNDYVVMYITLLLQPQSIKKEKGLIDEEGNSTSEIDFTVDYSGKLNISDDVYQLFNGIGGMLPNSLISAVSPLFGMVAMTLSGAGSKYHQKMLEGSDSGTAVLYSLVSSLGNSFLRRVFGTLPFIGTQRIETFKNLLLAIPKEMSTACGRNFFDILLESVLYHKIITMDEAIARMGKDAVYAALTSFIMNLPHVTSNGIQSIANNPELRQEIIQSIKELLGIELSEEYLSDLINSIEKDYSSYQEVASVENTSQIDSLEKLNTYVESRLRELYGDQLSEEEIAENIRELEREEMNIHTPEEIEAFIQNTLRTLEDSEENHSFELDEGDAIVTDSSYKQSQNQLNELENIKNSISDRIREVYGNKLSEDGLNVLIERINNEVVKHFADLNVDNPLSDEEFLSRVETVEKMFNEFISEVESGLLYENNSTTEGISTLSNSEKTFSDTVLESIANSDTPEGKIINDLNQLEDLKNKLISLQSLNEFEQSDPIIHQRIIDIQQDINQIVLTLIDEGVLNTVAKGKNAENLRNPEEHFIVESVTDIMIGDMSQEAFSILQKSFQEKLQSGEPIVFTEEDLKLFSHMPNKNEDVNSLSDLVWIRRTGHYSEKGTMDSPTEGGATRPIVLGFVDGEKVGQIFSSSSYSYKRNTIHGSLNGESGSTENGGKNTIIDSVPYIFIVPVVDLPKEQILSTLTGDTFIEGSFVYPKSGYIICPVNEVADIQKSYPDTTVIGYEGNSSQGYGNLLISLLGYSYQKQNSNNRWINNDDSSQKIFSQEGYVGDSSHDHSSFQYEDYYQDSVSFCKSVMEEISLKYLLYSDEDIRNLIDNGVVLKAGNVKRYYNIIPSYREDSSDFISALQEVGIFLSQEQLDDIWKSSGNDWKIYGESVCYEILRQISVNQQNSHQS